MEKVTAAGAGLVVFPETFVPTYPDWVWRSTPWGTAGEWFGRLLDQAVVVPSPATEAIGAAARRAGVWVSIGVNERDPAGSTLYNTQLYLGPDGAMAAKHRKLMPTGGERLVWGMGDGSTLAVVDTPFGRLGGLTCWENYMPLAGYAMSAIVGPRGEILAGPLVEEENILYAELDAARARAARMEFDPVGHYARPDVFRLVVDTRRQVTTEQDPAAGGPPADHTAAAGPRPDHGGASHAP
jgi:predicted amidohydrolase